MPDQQQRRWLRDAMRRTLRRRSAADVTVSHDLTERDDPNQQPTVRLDRGDHPAVRAGQDELFPVVRLRTRGGGQPPDPTPIMPEDAPPARRPRGDQPRPSPASAPRRTSERRSANTPRNLRADPGDRDDSAEELRALLQQLPEPAFLADPEPGRAPRTGRTIGSLLRGTGPEPRTRAVERPENLYDRPPVTRRPSPAWDVWAESHAGFRREDNQDSVSGRPPLIAVADGVGGGPAGDRASMIVLRVLRSALTHTPPDELDLHLSLRECSAALLGAAVADPALEGMATTLDAAVLGEPGSSAHVRGVHVGDGAVWLLEADRPPQDVTKSHRDRNGMLLHAVAGGVVPYCDEWRLRMRTGDRLVMASDGFHGQMPPAMVLRQLDDTRGMPARDASRALVRAALGAGGSDNVSVVVADLTVTGGEPGPGRRW
jgi:protein phosphatase